MQVLYERCCGLDVHKKHVAACLVRSGPRGTHHKEQRSFGTMTADLLRLRAWLAEADCTHVALESTGSYWKPIYNILEGYVELILANPQHVKGLPDARPMLAMRNGWRTFSAMG